MNARLRSVCTNASPTVVVLAALTASATGGPPPPVVNVPGDAATIQLGINAVGAGGEVIVAPGTYTEVIDFGGKALTLRSTDPDDPAVVAATIIDGTGLGASVVTCDSGEGAGTVMSGLTITGGAGTACGFGLCGGGMYNVGTRPTVAHCVFVENELGPMNLSMAGAGMYNDNAGPTVTDTVFKLNAARTMAGPMKGTGAQGGAVFNTNNSPPVFNGCLFLANSVGGGSFDGGAAVYNRSGAAPEMINCTVTENFAVGFPFGGGAIANVGASSLIRNGIVWSNPGGDLSGAGHVVRYTLVTAGFVGVGNIAGDPSFIRPADPGGDGDWGTVDDDEGHLRLRSNSPCIDAADNTAVPAGTTTDLGGDPRFVQDILTPDTGIGPPPVVDMGVFEYQACPADFDGNGIVGFADLTQLLAVWGPCVGCPEDLNNDGTVGFADLTMLLAMWGDCPDPNGPPV